MRTAFFTASLAIAILSSTSWAQTAKPKAKTPPQKQKQPDDLPDVALEIPTDTPPGVKAIMADKAAVLQDRKSKPSERAKACQVLGELGEQGKPGRRVLCRAMLDASPAVSEAAADALKKIDPGIQKWAVELVIGQENREQTLGGVEKLEDKGEPLTPLVLHFTGTAHVAGKVRVLRQGLITLCHIAPGDLTAYDLMVWALAHPDPPVRGIAIEALARMKHGRKAVPKLIVLLKGDRSDNQLRAMRTLTALADETNEESIISAVTSIRFHKDAVVRQAVDDALNKLKARSP